MLAQSGSGSCEEQSAFTSRKVVNEILGSINLMILLIHGASKVIGGVMRTLFKRAFLLGYSLLPRR